MVNEKEMIDICTGKIDYNLGIELLFLNYSAYNVISLTYNNFCENSNTTPMLLLKVFVQIRKYKQCWIKNMAMVCVSVFAVIRISNYFVFAL